MMGTLCENKQRSSGAVMCVASNFFSSSSLRLSSLKIDAALVLGDKIASTFGVDLCARLET
jgi:hypothetical protein